MAGLALLCTLTSVPRWATGTQAVDGQRVYCKATEQRNHVDTRGDGNRVSGRYTDGWSQETSESSPGVGPEGSELEGWK